MNTSKFSLADVLNVLAALVFSFICYLGFYFKSVGDLGPSLFKAIIAALLLFSTAFGAKLFKQTSKHFKLSLFFEGGLVLVFTLIVVFYTTTSFSHYFAVSNNKDAIQIGIKESVKSAENMFIAYETYVDERKDSYATKLESAVNNQFGYPVDFANMGFSTNTIALEQQIKEKIFTLNADLYPQNYNDIKEDYKKLIENSKKNTVDWKPMAVVSVVKHLDEKVPIWQNVLMDLSKHRASGENVDDFKIEIDFKSVNSEFSKDYKEFNISGLLALIAWALMLFPYFLAKRDGKRLTSIEKYEVVL